MTRIPYLSFLCGVSAILIFPASLHAASYYSGTGFVLTRQGQAVTNAHVIENCAEILVRTTDGSMHPATLRARDEKLDLALLDTALQPERPARLRHSMTDIQVQEKVMLMGYPQDAAKEGKYQVAFSTVRGLTGLSGETQWLQFEDSVRMGNSGGPLLDFAGNVVGVITGKATLIRHNSLAARDEVVDTSDFAINLETLRGFLAQNRVRYESRDSLMRLSDRQIESLGREFIVNVLCRQP